MRGADTLAQTSPRQVEMAALPRCLQQPGGNGRLGLFRPKTRQEIQFICLFEARHCRYVYLAGSSCCCCCCLLRTLVFFYFLPQTPTSEQLRSAAAQMQRCCPLLFPPGITTGRASHRTTKIKPFLSFISDSYIFVMSFWRLQQS